jgi:hypothetical protein
MSTSFRRYELLLPRQFNDGQPVPDELFTETLLELEQQFGAVSSETQSTRGLWRHEGRLYRDEVIRVYVDVADVPDNRQFFVDFQGAPQGAIPSDRHPVDVSPDRRALIGRAGRN